MAANSLIYILQLTFPTQMNVSMLLEQSQGLLFSDMKIERQLQLTLSFLMLSHMGSFCLPRRDIKGVSHKTHTSL